MQMTAECQPGKSSSCAEGNPCSKASSGGINGGTCAPMPVVGQGQDSPLPLAWERAPSSFLIRSQISTYQASLASCPADPATYSALWPFLFSVVNSFGRRFAYFSSIPPTQTGNPFFFLSLHPSTQGCSLFYPLVFFSSCPTPLASC